MKETIFRNLKTIFWNVDTQYDFMRNDDTFKGTLAVPGAWEIEHNLKGLTCLAYHLGIQIVNTADWHKPNSPEISATPDFKKTFPPHCLQNTKGAEYIPATNPFRGKNLYVISWEDKVFDEKKVRSSFDIVLYKDEFDAFHPRGGPHTEKVLEVIAPKQAVVYGVATDVCVDYAVKGLVKRGVHVIVPADAIKELPGSDVESIFREWRKLGVELVKTREIASLEDCMGI